VLSGWVCALVGGLIREFWTWQRKYTTLSHLLLSVPVQKDTHCQRGCCWADMGILKKQVRSQLV
jgi:hypothetical protein